MKLLAYVGAFLCLGVALSLPPAMAQDGAPIHHAGRAMRHGMHRMGHHMRAAGHRMRSSARRTGHHVRARLRHPL